MSNLHVPGSSIEFAKELSAELNRRDDLPDESLIMHTLGVMNGLLKTDPISQNRRLFGADAVFEIPDSEADVEMLEEWEMERARRENVIVAAKINQIIWFGCVSFRGFGLLVYGVDYLKPRLHHTTSAFVPLDSIGPVLAA